MQFAFSLWWLQRGTAHAASILERLFNGSTPIRATWPRAEVQLCVVHLVPSALRYPSKKHWSQVCREMRGVFTCHWGAD